MAWAKTISLLNMKGGVGKTALAVNLAWFLCRSRCKRVLLVDLDPQFNASQYLIEPEKWEQHKREKGTVADLLIEPYKSRLRIRKKKKTQSPIREYLYVRESFTSGARLDVLPSELVLAKAIKNPQGVEYKLEKGLTLIRDRYDYIIIDCAPTDSVLTDTALMASDYILIPVKPDRFSVIGYGLMQETLDEFRGSYPDPHSVRDLGVVFTQVRKGSSPNEDEYMENIEEKAEYVFSARIRWSQSYSRSVHEKTPIFSTSHARWATKEQISTLVKEMEQRIQDLAYDKDRES